MWRAAKIVRRRTAEPGAPQSIIKSLIGVVAGVSLVLVRARFGPPSLSSSHIGTNYFQQSRPALSNSWWNESTCNLTVSPSVRDLKGSPGRRSWCPGALQAVKIMNGRSHADHFSETLKYFYYAAPSLFTSNSDRACINAPTRDAGCCDAIRISLSFVIAKVNIVGTRNHARSVAANKLR